jgi:hypothetical protein
MLKVFGFVRRHARLSHDEYRAAHVGHHNSFGRRLNGIRGYALNVRSNRQVDGSLGTLLAQINKNEPDWFDDEWDGYGLLMFDTLESYLAARSSARDKAGPGGLEMDPRVAQVGGDGAHLYRGSPFQFHVDEHVASPVWRAERKAFKVVQFTKRPEGMTPEEFRAYYTGRYSALMAGMPGLRGMLVNFRTALDVMTGFFEPDADAFSEEGTALREKFYDEFDAMAELWFDTPDQFVAGRSDAELGPKLDVMEKDLFGQVFYREVDETVAVNANRAPAPDFYHR